MHQTHRPKTCRQSWRAEGFWRHRPMSMLPGENAMILTPDQRVRVFVSSTLVELGDERNAVGRVVKDDLGLHPVMFEAGARPHPPRDLHRAYLEQSHVYLGIFWESYG